MDKMNELGTGGSRESLDNQREAQQRKERIEALLSRQRSETAEATNAYDS